MPPRLVRISVRELIGFVLRAGDLVVGGFINTSRLYQGLRAHQQLQRSRPPSYRAELPITHLVESEPVSLEISGRVDGLLLEDDGLVVEEIKTVDQPLDHDPPEDPLHWAQLLVYAYMVAVQRGLTGIEVQLTYVCLDPWQVREIRRPYTLEELTTFFENLVGQYLRWARAYHDWCEVRDCSIQGLSFPFPKPRPGQPELTAAVDRAIRDQVRLFVQAPTGIGKTVSVLLPAVQALGEGRVDKVFYLTARTPGRIVAEKAVADLHRSGLRLKCLSLTARERICFHPSGPEACDPETCEFARGYFDRVGPALEELFTRDDFTRVAVEEIARRHRVCPFEFSLDLSLWSDLIICDYNYVFDPRVYLKRFFLDHPGRYLLLVDEAHNLVDRAREMFSAGLSTAEVNAARRSLEELKKGKYLSLERQLQRLGRELRGLGSNAGEEGAPGPWVSWEMPRSLRPILEDFLEQARELLVSPLPPGPRERLSQLYFDAFTFLKVAEVFDDHYVACAERTARQTHLRLLCLDPSARLAEALQRGVAAVFFSATLTPLEFFRRLLGGRPDDPLLSLDSPFPREHLRLLVADRIATTFRRRSQTLDAVAAAIGAIVAQRPGNYLVYFPSYRYLTAVLTRFRTAAPDTAVLVQVPGMSEAQREAFLAAFDERRETTLVGFALMGGIFGEGIDLLGERLVGAVVVGVGLPQICLERELIRNHFDEHGLPGFDYAYTYPGMNRVLQAAGRVIRSDEDRGVVLLVDERFGEERYRALLPAWWRPVVRVRTPAQVAASLSSFWQGVRETQYEPLETDDEWQVDGLTSLEEGM
ncbi:MAG: helicase C-terminal domain-containing protein [Candidatus Latescibacterota bacterium]|jgi:DNA excision repair protein ERCC-2